MGVLRHGALDRNGLCSSTRQGEEKKDEMGFCVIGVFDRKQKAKWIRDSRHEWVRTNALLQVE